MRFVSDDGISPLKLLNDNSKWVSCERFPSHRGNAPIKLQYYEIQMISKDYMFLAKSNDGILPLRPFCARFKSESALSFESDDGISPPKLLIAKLKSMSCVKFPSHMGNAPTKLQYYEIQMICKDYMLLTNSNDGILPLR